MLSVMGIVVRGKGEARGLGYPTANLDYLSDVHPSAGVWICDVAFRDATHRGLAVVGMWTLPHGAPSMEVHLLDADVDLYGAQLTVTLRTRLRDLMTFETTDALVAQIQQDVRDARAAFDV